MGRAELYVVPLKGAVSKVNPLKSWAEVKLKEINELDSYVGVAGKQCSWYYSGRDS